MLLYETIDSETEAKQREQELDADLFAAMVIARLGGSLEDIIEVIKNISTNESDLKSSHPNKEKKS